MAVTLALHPSLIPSLPSFLNHTITLLSSLLNHSLFGIPNHNPVLRLLSSRLLTLDPTFWTLNPTFQTLDPTFRILISLSHNPLILIPDLRSRVCNLDLVLYCRIESHSSFLTEKLSESLREVRHFFVAGEIVHINNN